MPIRHTFFNQNEKEAEKYEHAKKLSPDVFKERQKIVDELKADFLRRAQNLKLGIKYSSDHLVTNIFELRFEEGLQKLLKDHTEYEKVGNDFIFTHIDPMPDGE